MTGVELEQCRQMAEKWWPGIGWTVDRDTVRDFDRISLTAGRKAIDRLKDEASDRYPSLAKFLRVAKAVQGSLPRVADTPENCRHGTWAILGEVEVEFERAYAKRATEGLGFRVCVFCKVGVWGRFETVGDGEVEAGKETAA